jgi:hypothetical protein
MSDDSSQQLVSGPFQVTFTDRGVPQPGWAMVFSCADGNMEWLNRRPGAIERRRYRYRYDVSTIDHRLGWEDALPSATAGYMFRGRMELTWRVTKPEAVVQRGIGDTRAGDDVVRAGLVRRLVSRCRAFEIEDHAEAENDLNSMLGDQEISLPEGITVSRLTARLDLDMEAEQYVRRQRGLRWEADIASQEHKNRLGEVERQSALRKLTEQHEQAVQSARADALREAAKGRGGLLIQVVAQDPSQLRSVLQEVAARQDIEMEKKLKVFEELVANKLVQPADVDVMWQTLLQNPQPFGSPPELSAPPAGSTPHEDTPDSPPAVVLDDSDIVSRSDEPAPADASTTPDSKSAQSANGNESRVTGWRPVRGGRHPESGDQAT